MAKIVAEKSMNKANDKTKISRGGMIMKTETRELYCYTTGTEPFKSRYENLSTEMDLRFSAKMILKSVLLKSLRM